MADAEFSAKSSDREPAFEHRLLRRHGYTIHENVPASHWCVTKGDLRKFRRALRDEVHLLHVIPTADDPFDPADTTYGPLVRTVVTQMLKPISYMDGGSSWALIQNRAGLKCDLFVTHAWSEGMYEFIDKVLYSWPRGTFHAYCCMFSNPQTLDIGSFIANPNESPFAKALRSATHVLVVPNRNESIYERAWCTYEAYLAYKWDKTVQVASVPVYGLWRDVFALFLLGAASLIVTMVYIGSTIGHCSDTVYDSLVGTTRLLKVVTIMLHCSYGRVLCVINVSGVISWNITSGLRILWAGSWYSMVWFQLLVDCMISVFGQAVFICSHVDFLWHKQLIMSQTQLEKGYSGRISNSKASVSHDKHMILQEIRNTESEHVVDETIAVLLRCGMSTTSLRVAHANGVDITGAGVIKLKYLHSCMYAIMLQVEPYCLIETIKRIGTGPMIAAISVTWSFAFWWFTLFVRDYDRRDRIAYMASSGWKLLGLPFILLRLCATGITNGIEFIYTADEPFLIYWKMMIVWNVLFLPICVACVALTSVMDLGWLSSTVSRDFAQYVATNNLPNMRKILSCCRRRGILAQTLECPPRSGIELEDRRALVVRE